MLAALVLVGGSCSTLMSWHLSYPHPGSLTREVFTAEMRILDVRLEQIRKELVALRAMQGQSIPKALQHHQ